MHGNTVKRTERLYRIYSVRLTEYQSKRLQNTFRNFGIKGNSSEQLRLLLRKAHWSSVRYYTKHRELRRLAHLRMDAEAKALKSITVS